MRPLKKTVIKNDTVRYLSLYDNKYIRYFHGHEKRVTGIAISPVDDTLLTSSIDKTVRLWDLRVPTCQGILYGEGNTLVAIDPQAVIFAIAVGNRMIKLYDFKDFTQGPFATWPSEGQAFPPGTHWTSIKFTPDGKKLIITTMSDEIYVLDSFNGVWLQTLVGHAGPHSPNSGEEVAICPNAGYVVAGGSDAVVRMWNISGNTVDHSDGRPFHKVASPHKSPIHVMGFNPSHALLASGATDFATWLPTKGIPNY